MKNKLIACYLSFRHNLCAGRKDWPFLLGACAGDGKENERCDSEGSCVRSRVWEMSEKNMGDTHKQKLGEDFLFPFSRDQRDFVQSAPNQGPMLLVGQGAKLEGGTCPVGFGCEDVFVFHII